MENELIKTGKDLNVSEFLEELFISMKDLGKLLYALSSKISENLTQVSHISVKLSKVSEVTESATLDIMNTLDSISTICYDSLAKLNIFKNENIVVPKYLLDEILNFSVEKKPEKVEDLIYKIYEIQPDVYLTIDENVDVMNKIIENVSAIMMLLQFQDITTQQLAAANFIISTIQEKIGEIMEKYLQVYVDSKGGAISSIDQIASNISTLHREIAFDPHAIDTMQTLTNKQDEVDDLFAAFTNGSHQKEASYIDNADKIDNNVNTEFQNSFSQEDIDRLFGN